MDARKAALITTAAWIGIDMASGPDRTAYWLPPGKPKTSDPKKRAKVKAARKQRRKSK